MLIFNWEGPKWIFPQKDDIQLSELPLLQA